MAEQTGAPVTNRVRVVSNNIAPSFEREINVVLKEELANGAELIDIKLAATPPHDTSAYGQHVALIILQSRQAQRGASARAI
jgi:hypothetical protein